MVDGMRHFEVIEEECVGCNLCVNVCPVENCITMEPLAAGVMDKRTGKPVSPIYANWTQHPNNPDGQGRGGIVPPSQWDRSEGSGPACEATALFRLHPHPRISGSLRSGTFFVRSIEDMNYPRYI